MEDNSICSYLERSDTSLDCGASCFSNQTVVNTTMPGHDIVQWMYISLTAVMSVMSVVGSALIIFYYWRIPQLRNESRELLVYLSVCDMMIAMGNLLGISWWFSNIRRHQTVETDAVCLVQAVISSGFSIASFFWTTFIAANVFLTVVYNSKVLTARRGWLLHIFSWGVSTVVVAVTLGFHRFGFNPCLDLLWWCWVTPQGGDKWQDMFLWQLISGKFWEMLSYVLVCVLYAVVKITLARHMLRIEASLLRSDDSSTRSSSRHSSESSAYINAQKKLTYIPLVFMIGRIWGTLRFLLDIGPNTEIVGDYIAPLQGVGDSSQGFFNFLVIVLTTPQLREKFRCCRRGRRELSHSNLSQHNGEHGDDYNDTSDSDLDMDHPQSVQHE